MKPVPSIMAAIALLIVGLIPLYTMFGVQGRKIENPGRYIIWHKIAGYIFAVLAFFIFATMLWRARQYWFTGSPVVAVHVALAFSLLFLLTLKILVARFCKRLSGILLSLGTAAYLLAFALIGLTATHHLVWRLTKKAELSYREAPVRDTALSRQLLVTKCSGCHPLSAILKPRSEEAWKENVGRMLERSHSILTLDEANLILQFLVENQSSRLAPARSETSLIERHCLPCHKTTEIVKVSRSRQEWENIVTEMHERNADIVPEKDIDEIVEYLLRNQEGAVSNDLPQSGGREQP